MFQINVLTVGKIYMMAVVMVVMWLREVAIIPLKDRLDGQLKTA